MDHITAFPRPAAPELLIGCEAAKIVGLSLKANGCSPSVVFSSVYSAMAGRSARSPSDDPLCSTAPSHFFCRSRCRSQNDKPAVPLSGEIEAFFLESDPSSASTALRMSVFQVRIFHGACIPAVTPAPPIGFPFSRNLHFFNYHKTSVSFSDHTFFHSKKPSMT